MADGGSLVFEKRLEQIVDVVDLLRTIGIFKSCPR